MEGDPAEKLENLRRAFPGESDTVRRKGRGCGGFRGNYTQKTTAETMRRALQPFDIILHHINFTNSYPQFPPLFPQQGKPRSYAEKSKNVEKEGARKRHFRPRNTGCSLYITSFSDGGGRNGVPRRRKRRFYVKLTKASLRFFMEGGGVKGWGRPDPWWRRRSGRGRRCARRNTHSTPGHRSSRRYHRTTSGVAGTAGHRPCRRLPAGRRG